MANEFKARNGLIAQNNSVITGSLIVTNGITGSFTGSLTGSLFGTASWSNNSITSSYALNGGVTQLLAGQNITLSPTNGLGQVTVSATLSGSTIFNTATGSYGSFYDTTIQTNPVANVPRSMSFDSTDITNGVSISGSTNPFNTYIKTQNAGVYNIQFSAQVEKTDSGNDEIVIWLRKNGTDLTDTATTLTLSGNNDKQVAAWNWFVTSAANDYYQIIWFSADTDMRLLAETISATHPGIPSVILTVNRIDQFLSNTGSFSGSFTGQFTGSLLGTASYANQALTASYASTYAPVFPYTGSAIISGSLEVTGSISATTNITTPLIIGGSGVTSKLTYTASTNAAPTSTAVAHSFYVGNSGGYEALRILHNGRIGLNINPSYQFCVNGNDTANDGILISSLNYVNVPNPGTTTNTTLINGRGFNMATDSTVLTGSYIPTFGIGLASNRSGALLGLKNTSTSGYSILIEDGNMGVFTTNPYTELQVAGNITTTWANSNIGTWYQDGTSYRLGFNTNISNRQLNLHAYTADTGGYITFSTGTVGSPFVNLRINPAQTSGLLVNYDFTNPTSTNLTLSTNIPNFRISGANKQWATGTVTNQYWNYLTANTASFVGASTLGASVGLQIEAATAGTNATITNNFALGLLSGTATAKFGNITGTTNAFGIYLNQATPSSTNYAIRADSAGNNFINGPQLFLCVGGTSQVIMNGASIVFQSNNIQTSGVTTQYQFSPVNNTGQTASTEIPLFNINSATTNWLTGNITTQRNIWFKTRTLSFSGASTVTSSYGLYVEAATAGTNATITNNYAAGFSGSVQILTGGLTVTGSVNASSFTGSLQGTSSYAVTASYALNGGGGAAFPYTGSAIITGSLIITGSTTSTEGFTGSLQGTSSWASDSISASYASTASYVNGSIIKSNAHSPGIFGGTPLTASITFTADFPNPNYSVTITGEDARIFTIQNKSATGFEINTNSNIALTGNTYWHAISYGEFNS